MKDKFIDIVKSVSSTFVKESSTFQLIRKINLFKKETFRSHIQDTQNSLTSRKIFQKLNKLLYQLMKSASHPSL